MEIETYKQQEIHYSEDSNLFFVGDLTASSLKELKKKIDARLRKKFPRFEAYHCPYTDNVTEVTVTSIDVAGRFAWVTSDKGRYTARVADLYVKDEKSEPICQQMEVLSAVIEECQKELRGLKKKLKMVKLE